MAFVNDCECDVKFSLNLDPEVVKCISLKARNVFLDIVDSSLSKKCGNLSLSNLEPEFKSQTVYPQKANMKRQVIDKISPQKPKAPKTVNQEKSKSNSSIKLITTAMKMQPSFQQDPNDVIATMQSLDSGEKVFSCKLCGHQAKLKPNIRRHIVLKHMEGLKESFKCTVCGKEFNLKHHLKGHYMSFHNMNEQLAKAALTL